MTRARSARPQLPSPHMGNLNLARWAGKAAETTLTLFVGPAGYGKTTAMAELHEWLDDSGAAVAWFRLDEQDNSAETLSGNLHALFQPDRVHPGHASAPMSDPARGLVELLHWHERDFFVFLDEIETVTSKEAIALLSSIFERAPAQVHFILAGRSVKQLSIQRLKAGGRVHEIGISELVFGPEQAGEVLRFHCGRSFSDSEITQLVKETEGWPAGIRLAALFLQAGNSLDAFCAETGLGGTDISDYLWEEVFTALDADTRRFLCRTGFLEHLEPALCDAVCGIGSSGRILDDLVRRNLFITRLQGAGAGFRYHPLFARFLQQKLRETESTATIRACHERAAAWHLDKRDWESAISLLITVESWQKAGDLLEEWCWQILSAGRVRALRDRISALPEAERRQRPHLMVALGWSYILSHDYARCSALIEELKVAPEIAVSGEFAVLEPMLLAFDDRFAECEAALGPALERVLPDSSLALGTLLNVRSYIHLLRRDYRALYRLGQRAKAAFASRHVDFGTNYSNWFEVWSLISQGFLSRAHLLARENWDSAASGKAAPSSATALAASCHASTLYQIGEHEKASELITDQFDIILNTALMDSVIIAIRIVARTRCLCGDFTGAHRWLTHVMARADTRLTPRLSAAIELETHYIRLQEFDHGLTNRLPDPPPAPQPARGGFIPLSEDVENCRLAGFRRALRGAVLGRLAGTLGAAQKSARLAQRFHLALKLGVLRAQALAATGRKGAAMKQIEEVVTDAAGEGFVTCFCEEGAGVMGLVAEFRDRLAPHAGNMRERTILGFVERVLGNEPQTQVPARTMAAAPVPPLSSPIDLTVRERQVLACLSSGATNKEIARRLSVSENTVRFHLKNINQKLGTSNRTQAVLIARQMAGSL